IQFSTPRLSPPRFIDPLSSPQPVVPLKHSLPGKLSQLIGRYASIRALVGLLFHPRFVTLAGPGAMCDATGASAVAHTVLEAFGGAVYYVDLTSVTDASLIPATIASVLDLKVQMKDPKPSILAFLGARRALLVLDNCEHLIDEAATLAEWLYRSTSQTHL